MSGAGFGDCAIRVLSRKMIVCDLSRLARNTVDQGSTIAQLASLGIKLISIDEPVIDDTAAGKLAANMFGAMNQFFSDSLSEKTKLRMQAAVKNGRFIWVAPVGYLNNKDTKQIILDPVRAPLVRKGFELMATGAYSADDVLKTVTALGLTTRKGLAFAHSPEIITATNPERYSKSGPLRNHRRHQH